jgi:hypothetical protein
MRVRDLRRASGLILGGQDSHEEVPLHRRSAGAGAVRGRCPPSARRSPRTVLPPPRNRKALFECGVTAGRGRRRRRSTVGTAGAAQQMPCSRLRQTTGARGLLHCNVLSGVRCNVFCPVVSVVCCGVVGCPLRVASCPLQRCLFRVPCRRLLVARCQEPVVSCPLLVEHLCLRFGVVRCLFQRCLFRVACCQVSVACCRLHVARRLLWRRPLSVATCMPNIGCCCNGCPLPRCSGALLPMAQGCACTSSRCGRSSAARCAINSSSAINTRYTGGGRKSHQPPSPSAQCPARSASACQWSAAPAVVADPLSTVSTRSPPPGVPLSAVECAGVESTAVGARPCGSLPVSPSAHDGLA